MQKQPVRGLICLLSPTEFDLDFSKDTLNLRERDNAKSTAIELPAANLDALLDELTRRQVSTGADKLRWNWAQLLRALRPHLKLRPVSLKFLILVASPQSSPQLDAAATLLRHFLDKEDAKGCTILRVPQVDFEDMDSVNRIFLHAIIPLLNKWGIHPMQIAVDLTGGQKLTSVAAAISTLNNQSVLQYVQTGGNYNTDIYDLRFDHVPHRE